MVVTIGHGFKFQLGDGAATENFTTISDTTSVDFGSNKIDTVDSTSSTSPGNFRQFISGLEDPGDVTIKMNVHPGDTSQASLQATKSDGLIHDFKLIYPNAARTISFSGFVTSIDESVPDDKIPTLTVKVKISGAKNIA